MGFINELISSTTSERYIDSESLNEITIRTFCGTEITTVYGVKNNGGEIKREGRKVLSTIISKVK